MALLLIRHYVRLFYLCKTKMSNIIFKMNWIQLLSTQRFGLEEYTADKVPDRTEYQRDYDRFIFSSPFRRLQNKTQVFPLPGSIFVHNRLTHSLEVASVGRSIGHLVGKKLREKYPDSEAHFEDIGSIVSAACLAHDLGNPPFGHSGEKAISTFFSEGAGRVFEEKVKAEGGRWTDFTCFEGNANAVRLLMHQFKGRRSGGFVMTYTTLSSIVKYPYSSELSGGKNKFGFFQSEEKSYLKISKALGLKINSESPLQVVRHPLVYLVEAADDICYQIMDLEDAHKLHLITSDKVKDLFLNFMQEDRREKKIQTMNRLEDVNEQISYLRSTIIGDLVEACADVFIENENKILKGEKLQPLIKLIDNPAQSAYAICSNFAVKNIYRSKDVLDIELAGYRIIGFLLEKFTHAIQNPQHAYSKILLGRIPEQYAISGESITCDLQSILDYVSGMTDVYALDLYRKITGIGLPII